jgi:fructose-1,6-bisphosphatase/inositol monophosphatase family enzyme/transcriptional regulator with XRE-family HTH domain
MRSSAALSQKIVALREVQQMTQQDLADKLGVSRALVGAWETERSQPGDEQIALLAEILRVSENSLQPQGVVLPERYRLQELLGQVLAGGEELCTSLSDDLRRGAFNPIVQEVMDITKREQQTYETWHWRHPLDKVAHERFLDLVEGVILPFFPAGLVVFSEELIDQRGVMKPLVLPESGLDGSAEILDYVIVDPLDRTAEAVRAIAGFANLTIGSFEYGPLVSVVYSLFDRHVSCYYAVAGQGAWVKYHSGSSQPISPAATTDPRGASLAAYVGRPVRLGRLAACENLIAHHEAESTFVNASGCYGFCMVASSQVDAFIEVAKGFAWHDIVSGAHILHEAGGVVKDLGFDDLCDPLDPSRLALTSVSTPEHLAQLVRAWAGQEAVQGEGRADARQVMRQPFVAAATYELGAKIAIELARDNEPHQAPA